MKKNIYLILLLFLIITSCGKKSDPVFNEKKTKIFTTKTVVIQ